MMDRNTLIGMLLIFGLFLLWMQLNQPSKEQVEAQKLQQDSLNRAHAIQDSVNAASIQAATSKPTQPDSASAARMSGEFGPFAASLQGSESVEIVENDLIKVAFSNKGGRIREVELKHYSKLTGPKGQEYKVPVKLIEDPKNKFEYWLPVAGSSRNALSTNDFYFQAERDGNTVVYRLPAGNGKYMEQRYTLQPNSYTISYDVRFVGMSDVLRSDVTSIELNWENYLDKLEKNADYERNYSTVYYKPAEESSDYCSCTKNDNDNIAKPIKWVSNSNQFFNTSLIAAGSFASGNLQTEMYDNTREDLKRLQSQLRIPFGKGADETFSMQIYSGPNEYERLKAFNISLQDIIPFGSSILGTINRWLIRPVFAFLSVFIGSKGFVILLLTLLVKLLLFPLTYRMVYSQSKMAALKPYIEKLKSKLGNDQQQVQMETMKLYREYGVNPLGGCLPMLLQMPIWLALYRFFPASIEFRQASFLWAPDLSTYDAVVNLPFSLPGFGTHISLFALLWMVTTLIYTWYNSQNMDFSSNPAMKYMQYIMPVMFVFFFNSFASGLSCYLCFSNILNIGQTLGTKYFLIDNDKIMQELEAHKAKPKKKGSFQERLEKAMQEQQRQQQQRQQPPRKK